MVVSNSKPLFPNYTQVKDPVPQWFWYAARLLTVGVGFGLVAILFLRPDTGLFIFWRMIVPVLPLIFFVVPGFWRNICPMAALNQTPRFFDFTRAVTLPPRVKEYAYVAGIILFFTIVPTRKALLNTNGPALGILLLAVFTTAFLGGVVFKGKSGWCSSICPLLPVQRLYGQTPFINIPNNHCKPCVGCAKNCFDFNPRIANMADHYDRDEDYRGYRKFFAGAFPGLVLAFYTVPNPPEIEIPVMYFFIALIMLTSVGLYYALDLFTPLSAPKITTLFGAAALNLYYWFNIPLLGDTLDELVGVDVPEVVLLVGHVIILSLTLYWIYRTFAKEPLFLSQSVAPQAQIKANVSLMNSIALRQSQVMENTQVTFEPDNKRVLTAAGTSLLELAEANNLTIEAGCRMGVCGADPVAILEGMENLSAVSGDEKTTLERLGLAENTRMACCARVQSGAVKVSLQPEKATVKQISIVQGFNYDEDVKQVVIIGNGIAGITAADHVRRRHPLCDIHVIAREKHNLYNRMGLSRLIYGRSAMQGLYLLPDSWYDDHQITTWLNTLVTHIDRERQLVTLADGTELPYDRLILAMGSSGRIPRIDGFGTPGSFVLREADDAMAMRAYAQENRSRKAVVSGGGLLGLEAAYALHKLGLEVTVLERGPWLMRRQLDERGAAFLQQYLNGIGIDLLLQAEVDTLQGLRQVNQVTLQDGRTLPCDLFLICAGIVPNVELAEAAGIAINRGVLVDESMQTSDPNIYAAGDIAEYDGQIYGLWPVAVEQAQTAAINVAGGEAFYEGIVPTTMLKVAGIDLMSIGNFETTSDDDEVIVLEDPDAHEYRKLVISENRIVGAILLGFPRLSPIVTNAIKDGIDVGGMMPELRAGRWDVLEARELA